MGLGPTGQGDPAFLSLVILAGIEQKVRELTRRIQRGELPTHP